MNLKRAIWVVCLSIAAVAAEIALYRTLGLSSALRPRTARSVESFVLFGVVALTASAGILTLIGYVYESRTKRRGSGFLIVVVGMLTVIAGLAIRLIITNRV